MAKDFLTDEQVELEIERLSESPAVMLARQEQRIKYRRRQYMVCVQSCGRASFHEGEVACP